MLAPKGPSPIDLVLFGLFAFKLCNFEQDTTAFIVFYLCDTVCVCVCEMHAYGPVVPM